MGVTPSRADSSHHAGFHWKILGVHNEHPGQGDFPPGKSPRMWVCIEIEHPALFCQNGVAL
jgi:hypothetical protein